MRHIIIGFILTSMFSIYVILTNEPEPTLFGTLKLYVISTVFITPLTAILSYTIEFAGIPLFRDFVKGDIKEKLLIVAIVIILVYIKFF